MKKSFIVLLALLVAGSLAFAADSSAPYFAPGNLTVQADLGTGFFFGLDISGGAEFGLGSFKIGDAIPLTYGVAARVGYAGWTLTSYKYSDIAIGGLATLHISWKDVLPDLKWLSKVESYAGLGLGVDLHTETDTYYNHTGLAFAGVEGNNWYLTPNLALNLEEGYFGYGYNSYARFGITFKL
jgi:hypothetical protein